MEISHDEFNKRLHELAEKKEMIKNLLSVDKGYGNYENLPQDIKDLIDIRLGVMRSSK